MATFKLLESCMFITTNNKMVRAEKGTLVRATKDGRIMLVRTIVKRGGVDTTSTKERPTMAYLTDVKDFAAQV